MTHDQKFLKAVEAGEIPLAEFTHSAHVRLAWLYLTQHPLPEALICFRDTLKRFATRNGKAELYHETITFAFLLLIHERIHQSRTAAITWAQFATTNQEIITRGRSVLLNYYREETLTSDNAKKVFRLPDR